MLAALLFLVSLAGDALAETFDRFLATLAAEAAARGISSATFNAAFAGLTPDLGVLAAMRREPEYGKPMGAYLAGLVSPARIATGRNKLVRWHDTLNAVERRYGVDPAIVVSIWGIESSFGAAHARWDVFRSLATLAQAGFQRPYFHDELFSALTILQQGRLSRQQFLGSWAGAMGQPQFMPSSYLRDAVDFEGRGFADIWNNIPDVLASIANYLHKAGWRPNLPWGFEVTVPPHFDFGASRGSWREWSARGFRRADGGTLPGSQDNAMLYLPSCAGGPAFLVSDNFVVIKKFNNSDAYALAAGELADRLRGRGPIRATWPANDFQPSRSERMALERRLVQLGYKVADLDGHLDFDIRDDIRTLQRRFGMIADGCPSRRFLSRLGIVSAQ